MRSRSVANDGQVKIKLILIRNISFFDVILNGELVFSNHILK